MLKLSVTAVRLWSEFKSSAPWWLLSICQLRGVWEAEPEGEWGKERERETRPCFSVWHLVAHLRFLLQRQWGFWAHWQHRAHTKAQKNTAIHSNKFSARLYVWAHKCWDEAMQMQGVHRAQQKELSSRCVNRYDVIQRLQYFCLEALRWALRWAFWSLHAFWNWMWQVLTIANTRYARPNCFIIKSKIYKTQSFCEPGVYIHFF